MKNYKGLKTAGILTALLGLLGVFNRNPLSPIMMATGILIVTFIKFKNKNQNTTASIIIAATLAVMVTLEYFLVPMQNTAFYILLLIISLGIFLTFYFSLKPQNRLANGEKILAWTGSILFGISFLILMGIITNNYTLSLIIGVFTFIMLLIGLFNRRRISKEESLKDEFDEELKEDFDNGLKDEFNDGFDDDFITEKVEGYWFKYEVGGMAKPVRWQGWACYVIMFLSPFMVLIFDRDINTALVIILAIIFTFIIISMLKSNYKEIITEYRKDLKK